MAALGNIPVKIGGVDGSQVEAYVAAGRLTEVADYCLTDVLATHCVFLRYEMVRGDLTPAHLDTSMNSLRATVQKHAERRPLLSEFLKWLQPKFCIATHSVKGARAAWCRFPLPGASGRGSWARAVVAARCKDEGAKLHWGGEILNRDDPGFYLQPALFTEVDNRMQIAREEIFGPVAGVILVMDY
jgi:hypothetical protein